MLNESQTKAVKTLKHALNYGKAAKLIAPAGYGKTFLINYLIEHKVFKNPLVIAETNQATNLLRGQLNSNASIKTVCSALNYVLSITPHGYELVQKTTPDWRKHDVVILDEASQSSKVRFDEIKTRARKLIIAGDDLQLPPVGEIESPAFSHSCPTVELTIPMRNTTAIYDYCTKLRASIKHNKILPNLFNTSLRDTDKLIKNSLTDFLLGDAAFIAFSEKGEKLRRVHDINSYIKKELFNSSVDSFNIGEFVVFKKPFIPYITVNNTLVKDTTNPIFTNQRATIDGIQQICITVLGKVLKCYLVTFHLPENPENLFEGYLPIKDDNYNTARAIAFSSKSQKTVEEFFSYWIDIKPAYAINAYICQGLSIPKVIVDYNDITNCTRNNHILRLKMLYVAASRAVDSLHVLV